MCDLDPIDGFEVRPDSHCLRGLHFVYTTARPIAADRLIANIRRVYPRHLVEATEQWGGHTVHRLIVQFRFEVRIGGRPGEISFIHRVFASPAQCAGDRANFESSLLAALGEGASS